MQWETKRSVEWDPIHKTPAPSSIWRALLSRVPSPMLCSVSVGVTHRNYPSKVGSCRKGWENSVTLHHLNQNRESVWCEKSHDTVRFRFLAYVSARIRIVCDFGGVYERVGPLTGWIMMNRMCEVMWHATDKLENFAQVVQLNSARCWVICVDLVSRS